MMSDIGIQHVAPSSTRVGWIGTGVMGAAMSSHLLKQGYGVTMYTRTKTKSTGLLAEGARWAVSPKSLAEQSDVIFTMVGFPQDVRDVYFGDAGVLAGARAGSIVVDMTTTSPQLSREIHDAAKARGVAAIDAPVSGGDIGARQGTLSIMIGGDRAVADTLMPLFQILGKTMVYQGGPGAGQHTKLCNQIVIAGTMIGVCESLLYGYKMGLDLETMLRSIKGGAAACWTLENLASRILQRNFDPGFFVDHFVKDMGLALEEARRMGLVLPGLALVHQLYLSLQAHGHGRCGTHALMLALEDLSNVKVTPESQSS
jgi:3-hydroxyisobutyrate dehydrogenase